MTDLWTKIRELRSRDERRSGAEEPVKELLLVTKVSEESNEAAELYRRYKGWGTNGAVNATLPEVQDEICAAIMAGMVALDRISPGGTADEVWKRYLDYGYDRAKRENA
ncbi:hypothetical protein KQY30_25615 [Streptomyces sp. GMY02]|uniref:hypothetical protein n=1 Tax=Streptomyces sp. GMY02 TaxID=1333528 RepID=UPI001C2B77A1|nr:hypothetical protein [Streptomyces sp. GMY02]QXE37091.1 hypothetical protein KQY30_25615 [Streptomyces sp. GMY02]